MWGQVLGAVAGPLISGLFGRSQQGRAPGIDYQRLRRDAERAGFNPLTALLAGGGAGYQREYDPALSSGSFVAEAVARGVDTYFNQATDEPDYEADKVREQQQRNADAQAAAARPRSTFGFDLSQVEPFDDAEVYGGPSLGRPRARPTPGNAERVPAYDPSGRMVHLLPDVAARLDILPFGNIMAGDWVELVGEVGEIETGIGSWGVRETALGVNPFALRPTYTGAPHTPPELPPLFRGSLSGSPSMFPYWHGRPAPRVLEEPEHVSHRP